MHGPIRVWPPCGVSDVCTAHSEHLAGTVTRAQYREQTGEEGVRGQECSWSADFANFCFLSSVV